MWFLKHVSSILLFSSHLSQVTATTSNVERVARMENLDNASVVAELALNNIHTAADLEEVPETYTPTTVDDHQDPSVATESGHIFSSRSAPPKHPMSDDKKFTFISLCVNGNDMILFKMNAFFDGSRVHFKGKQSIDGFGQPTMSRVNGNTLISNAHFYHSACRTLSPTFICVYQYSGTARATVIPYGKTKHLSLDAYQEQAKEKNFRPVVKEACVRHEKEQDVNCSNIRKVYPTLTLVPCESVGIVVE